MHKLPMNLFGFRIATAIFVSAPIEEDRRVT